MNTSAARNRGLWEGSVGRVPMLAAAASAATTLLFIPILLRSPSTTEALPAFWLVAFVAAPPLTAYLLNRRLHADLGVVESLLVGLPQLPVIVVLSVAGVWLDVQRGFLLAGSGEEAMSYGIGISVSAVAGAVLLVLVAVAARLGGIRRN